MLPYYIFSEDFAVFLGALDVRLFQFTGCWKALVEFNGLGLDTKVALWKSSWFWHYILDVICMLITPCTPTALYCSEEDCSQTSTMFVWQNTRVFCDFLLTLCALDAKNPARAPCHHAVSLFILLFVVGCRYGLYSCTAGISVEQAKKDNFSPFRQDKCVLYSFQRVCSPFVGWRLQ